MSRSRHRTTAEIVDGDRPVRSIVRLLADRPGRLTVALGAFAVKETPVWFLPVITGSVIDIVAEGGSVRSVLLWCTVAISMLALNYPMHVLYTRSFMTVVRDTGARLRNALVARLQTLSIGYYARSSAAVVQSKVVRDVENIEMMLQQVTHPLLSALMVLIGAVTMTAIRVPEFLPVYALAVPLALFIRRMMARRSRRRNELFRREMESFAGRVGQMASLIGVTRAHGLERAEAERVAAGADDVRRAGLELDMLNGRVASVSWVTMQVLGVCCLVAAAVVALSGVIPVTPGEVVILSTYFGLLTQGLTQVLNLVPVSARGIESTRSVAEVLADPDLELNEGRRAATAVRGRLRMEHVTHRFADAESDTLHDVDLEIREGETVAFVGSSGSGKSTLLNLVLGFVRPTGGRILLDGVDMAELDLRTVRRWVSVVPQESVLFEGSIRDNVAYGLDDPSDDRIRAALRDANALDFVEALPHGWHTVVGQRGARISGGQRQRIAIARAVVRDPRILFLDEATSALDPESELAVRDALDHLMADRTTLVVAHRLSTVRRADRIVVLESGRVVEVGTHAELLRRGGRYAALHVAQEGSEGSGGDER